MEKDFEPRIELFDPFVVPFSEHTEVVFSQRDMDACSACCACTACTACTACR